MSLRSFAGYVKVRPPSMNHTFRYPKMSIKASVVLGLVVLTALV
jgi:hypothetical protein